MTFFTYYNKTFEVVNYCHKVICCNKEVIASTCLLQYVEFIATRSLCCVNLFASKFITTVCNNFFLHCNNILLQRLCSYYNDFVVIATIFPIVTSLFSCSACKLQHKLRHQGPERSIHTIKGKTFFYLIIDSGTSMNLEKKG